MRVVGNKSVFAVEYEVLRGSFADPFGPLARFQLWVGAMWIGSPNISEHLAMACDILARHLTENAGRHARFVCASRRDLPPYEDVSGASNSFGENFDDYGLGIVTARHERRAYFLWQAQPGFQSVPLDYPAGLQIKSVPQDVFDRVIHEFFALVAYARNEPPNQRGHSS